METEQTESPRILIFTMTSWNSRVGANTWESLLVDFDDEKLANIYLRDEIPDSQICSRYFCISENRVVKSIFKRTIQTGCEIVPQPLSEAEQSQDLLAHNKRYAKMKKKRRYSMLLARELCWKLGNWKTKELTTFLQDFKPDIILHSMDGYIHMNRLVRYAQKCTGAKAIGYIWDDNFTYKQSKKIGYKIYRYFQRKSLKKLAKKTEAFFAITPKTKAEADKFFGINCKVLSKPLNAEPKVQCYKNVQKPLRMLYTGNLLIGRDKVLKSLAQTLERINENEERIVLDAYTQTTLQEEYLRETQNKFCNIYPPIPQSEVLQKQKDADILLFLEDLSDKNLTARLSFSTKITDYFSTGKCIFAIGNPDLVPMQYFEETQSAAVVYNEEDIYSILEQLLEDSSRLEYYAKNAVECGLKNHSQERIKREFQETINEVYNRKA